MQTLGEVLDLNNNELCKYARKDRFNENKWQEAPKSIRPPFSIGFCAFEANAKYGGFYDYCTQRGEMKQAEMAQAIRENPSISVFLEAIKDRLILIMMVC
ncbi:hypothetical protein [Helicobacter bilis]|uniref:hypothetical protein n=1 Tax=Helicobacter bilis TaxID=37372 RepID=UPI000480618F|nr:hypothetical protein [Helicobacter bilis]